MAEKTKKRIFYYDELRALAILLVILCHIVILYKPFTYDTVIHSMPGLVYILTHVAVPIFFMLSGALLLNRTYDLPGFFKKRFSRILLPFLFWAIIAIAVSLFVLGKGNSEAFKIFFGKGRWTWFVWTMMGIYLFLPIVNSFIKEFKLKGAEYFIAVWLVTIILNTIGKYPFYRLELSYFAGYIGFTVLGYWLANKSVDISDKKMILIGFIMFVVCMAVDFYFFKHHVPKIETKYLSLFVVLASVGVFLIFKRYAHYCETNSTSLFGRLHSKIENGRAGNLILSLSVCSYGIYLVHSIISRCIKQMITINSLKQVPMLFIVITILSWLIIYALSKIPVLDKFSGAG